jgi:hypothetical protein
MKTAESPAPARLPERGPCSVFTLKSHEIEDHWFWIERFLQRVENPPWKPKHVKADLKAAQAQAWVFGDGRSAPVGLVITRIETLHDVRFGLLWIAAGTGLERAGDGLAEIEAWFKRMGCVRSEIVGRRGWGRVLPDYQEAETRFVKELG